MDFKVKIDEIPVLKSYDAFQTFCHLILGMNSFPAYNGMAYNVFHEEFGKMSDAEKEELIRASLALVRLDHEDIWGILKCAEDKNGVAFSKLNSSKMKIEDAFEVMTHVCLDIAKIKITLISEEEKKKFPTSQLT